MKNRLKKLSIFLLQNQDVGKRIGKGIAGDLLRLDVSLHLSLIVLLLSLTMVALTFIIQLDPLPNDDTYIFFNYAKNFSEGRFFAYDQRNFPSHGFTSPLYLLMLVPFEFFKINLSFAAILLSFLGISCSILVAWLIFYRSKILDKYASVLFVALFASILLTPMITSNTNMLLIVSRAMETTWQVVFILLGILACCAALDPVTEKSHRSDLWIWCFFVAAFLSYLVRPENIAIMAVAGLYLFRFYPKKARLLGYAFLFALCFLVYLGFAYLLFGDPFPSGFYRKFAPRKFALSEMFQGTYYVLRCLGAHLIPMLLVGFLLLLDVFQQKRGGRESLIRHHPVVLLLVCSLANIVIMLKTKPLIGYGFRFLYVYMFTIQLLLSLTLAVGIVRLVSHIARKLDRPAIAGLFLIPLIVLLIGFLPFVGLAKTHSLSRIKSELNLHAQCVWRTENHPYIRFGRFLKKHVPEHKNVTLVFGDAGAIPYSFECNFIDTNGLTEPFITHLFMEDDLDKRVQLYIEYILANHPDIIVLAHGKVRGGINYPKPSSHKPFPSPQPKIWKAYQAYGIEYFCSLPMGLYDLHIGVNSASQHIGPISTALWNYMKKYQGYVVPEGLKVQWQDDVTHFERYILNSR